MTKVDFSDKDRELWDRASSLIDDNEFESAIQILNKILAQPRAIPKVYAHRGFAHYQLEQFRAALKDFSEALRLKPNGKNTLFLRGRCHEELGQFIQAINDYNLVLKAAPDTADAHAHKGYCLEKLGQIRKARLAYQAALLIDPSESLALAGIKELERFRRTLL